APGEDAVAEGHAADERVDVADPGLHEEQLEAVLHEVASPRVGERSLEVVVPRRLELRRRGVAPERREALEVDLGDAPDDVGSAGDVLEADLRWAVDAEVRRVDVEVPARVPEPEVRRHVAADDPV